MKKNFVLIILIKSIMLLIKQKKFVKKIFFIVIFI